MKIELSKKIGDGVIGLLLGMAVPIKKTPGWSEDEANFKITTITSHLQAGIDLFSIEAMASKTSKGWLYNDSAFFVFHTKEDLIIMVAATELVELFQKKHNKKELTKKVAQNKILLSKTGRIFGFLSIADLRSIALSVIEAKE